MENEEKSADFEVDICGVDSYNYKKIYEINYEVFQIKATTVMLQILMYY